MAFSTSLPLRWLACILVIASLGFSIPSAYHASHEVQQLPPDDNALKLDKRDPPDFPRLAMAVWRGDTSGFAETYSGLVEIKDLKGFDLKDPKQILAIAEHYAQEGYNQVKDKQKFNGVVLVSAQFTPDVGVWVGSKPRGAAAAQSLFDLAAKYHPKYTEFIGQRDFKVTNTQRKPEDILHAEDHVLIRTAQKICIDSNIPTMGDRRFSKGTYAATFGRYSTADTTAEIKPPCGAPGTDPKFNIACTDTNQKFGIGWDKYKGPVGVLGAAGPAPADEYGSADIDWDAAAALDHVSST